MSSLPNLLTGLRILLLVPIAWTMWSGHYLPCLIMLIVAGVSDALDGFLARRLDSISRFGELADPIADKLLAFVVVVMMLATGLLPLWLGVIVIAREVVIVSGALAFRSVVKRLDIEPLLISRINTVVQVFVLCTIIAAQTEIAYLAVITSGFVNLVGYYLMAIFAVASGVAYVYGWTVRLQSHLAQLDERTEAADP